ncbi:MAG: hypothetical protein M1330_04745 [Armatimonadetes bacterium]|nr:hypothetical protein [Armatimonadota bacterium]
MPEVSRMLGTAIRELRKASHEVMSTFNVDHISDYPYEPPQRTGYDQYDPTPLPEYNEYKNWHQDYLHGDRRFDIKEPDKTIGAYNSAIEASGGDPGEDAVSWTEPTEERKPGPTQSEGENHV